VKHSIMAAGFGVLNLAYWGSTAGACFQALAAVAGSSTLRTTVARIADRLRAAGSAFLLTLENPEPRYTLECYPAVIVFAAAYLAQATKRERHAGSHFSNPDSCS